MRDRISAWLFIMVIWMIFHLLLAMPIQIPLETTERPLESINTPQVKYYELNPTLHTEITKCILGEARGEGLKGMTAVSEAIRNRGTLKGVYGCRAKFKEPQWVWDMARKAWNASISTNLVKGGTHWESVDFPKPYWADSMQEVYRYKKHIFYKENNHGRL